MIVIWGRKPAWTSVHLVAMLRDAKQPGAVLTDAVRPETVLIYEGGWDSLGGSVNRLTSDDLSDMGESATYHDVRCRLSRMGGAQRR
jgi:anaerobic selenocysteine-containing dehydrogenase